MLSGSDSELYSTLTTHVVTRCDNQPLVNPNNSSESALAMVVQQQCMMLAMPMGCAQQPASCLGDEDINLIVAWIDGGAPGPE